MKPSQHPSGWWQRVRLVLPLLLLLRTCAGPRGASAVRLGAISFSTLYGPADTRGDFRAHAVSNSSDGGMWIAGVSSLDESDDVRSGAVLAIKYSSTGTLLRTVTIDGSDVDVANAAAEEPLARGAGLWLTGVTHSDDYNQTKVFQRELPYRGLGDALVTRVAPNGTATFSGFFGGSELDIGLGLSLGRDGGAWVVGVTESFLDLWVFGNAHQRRFGGGGSDGFWARFSSVGEVIHSGYFGGNGDDAITAITDDLDANGGVWICGRTTSTNLAVKGNNPEPIFQRTLAGGVDAFIAHVTAEGALLYSTYLGGTGDDVASAITKTTQGEVWVAGWTSSGGDGSFPLRGTTQQPAYGGGDRDAFVAKFNGEGRLLYTSYLGGDGTDEIRAVAPTLDGGIWFAGSSTSATGVPSSLGAGRPLDPPQNVPGGGSDGLLGRLSRAGVVKYTSYFGGAGDDMASGVRTSSGGRAAWFAGWSPALPPSLLTSGAVRQDGRTNSTVDAFVAAIGESHASSVNITRVTPWRGVARRGSVVNVTILAGEGEPHLVAGASCRINNKDTCASFYEAGGGEYVFAYRVAPGDARWGKGGLQLAINLQDFLGNQVPVTVPSRVPNRLVGDPDGAPAIRSVSFDPPSGRISPGEALRVTLRAANEEEALLSGSPRLIDGRPISGELEEVLAGADGPVLASAVPACMAADAGVNAQGCLGTGDYVYTLLVTRAEGALKLTPRVSDQVPNIDYNLTLLDRAGLEGRIVGAAQAIDTDECSKWLCIFLPVVLSVLTVAAVSYYTYRKVPRHKRRKFLRALRIPVPSTPPPKRLVPPVACTAFLGTPLEAYAVGGFRDAEAEAAGAASPTQPLLPAQGKDSGADDSSEVSSFTAPYSETRPSGSSRSRFRCVEVAWGRGGVLQHSK
eukprot:jgi/Mesvir1/16190/Mv08454-RA.2